jgi:hypothetical protein
MTPDRVCTWTRPDGTTWHTGQSINRTKGTRSTTKPPGTDVPVDAPAVEYRQPSLC